MNNIRAVIDGIISNEHAKIVVAGVLGDNLPPNFYQCPQIIIWSAEQAGTARLPKATKLVLTTRFVGHASLAHLDKECKSVGTARAPKPYGTGELRTLLLPVLEAQTKRVKVEPIMASIETKPLTQKLVIPPLLEKPRVFERGERIKFIREHKQGYGKKEVDRLIKLMVEQGWEAPMAVRVYSDLHRLKGEDVRVNTPPVFTPAGPRTDLIALLDDAISALHLVKEALGKQTDASDKLAKVLEALK